MRDRKKQRKLFWSNETGDKKNLQGFMTRSCRKFKMNSQTKYYKHYAI